MKKTFLVVALGALFFAGCGEEQPKEQAYTEKYYKENPDDLKKQLEFCEKNKNGNLSTIQQQNCKIASLVEHDKQLSKAPF